MITFEVLPSLSRLRIVRQNEAAECGVACIAMILSHHGRVMDLRELRMIGGASLEGSTLKDLIELGSRTGLGARGVKVDIDGLKGLRLPAILHWDMNHFVVLERVRGNRINIVDPAAGRRQFTREELSEHFTGVALELWPDIDFRKATTVRRLQYRDLLRETKGLVRHLGVIFLFSLTTALLGLAAPQYVQYAIDQAVVNNDPQSLAIVAVGFVILLLFSVAVSILTSFSILNLRTVMLFQFRRNLFRHLLSLPFRYFESRSVGDILSRVDSYNSIQDTFSVEAVETAIQSLMAIAISALLFFYSWKIVLVVWFYIAVSLALNVGFVPAQRRRSMAAITVGAKANSLTIESVRGSRSIKALALESRALDRWSTSQAEAINADLGVERLMIWQRALQQTLEIANTVMIPGLALYLVITDELTLGMFYAVNVYKGQLIEATDALIGFFLKLAQDTVHLERLSDIALEEPEDSTRGHNESSPGSASGAMNRLPASLSRIELVEASFRHAETSPWTFQDVSLSVACGERVGLTGPSGSGKTTLLNVLASLTQPVEGTLKVDGQALGPGALREFRGRLGMVAQDDTMFAGSVASNVARQAENIDMERVKAVCRLADVHGEIEAKPMGYQTLVGDMGSALSTGQRQRLLLARALYARPDFLLLDEGTSHLSLDSEQRILKKLDQLRVGIVFAVHGTAALDLCDRIYLLDDGELKQVFG